MAVVWLNGSCPDIPEISDAQLALLSKRITPIKRRKEGCCENVAFLLHPVELRRQSFLWDPAWGARVDHPLYEVARIETYHSSGYGALFKPSVAEVLAQIPSHLHNVVDYAETLDGDTVAVYAEHDGHRTVTVLYSRNIIGSAEWHARSVTQA